MSQYFAYDYTGNPFVLFGVWHITALLIIVLINFAMLGFRKSSEKTRRAVRWTMAIVLWLNEASWHIWNIYWGHWSVQTMLPLHVCSAMIWLAGFMLIFKIRPIYEFAYFIGIGGAMQALLTPEAGIYGFPHFRIFQTLISHGLLITATVYMTTVEGFRPTWKSFWRVLIGLNIYAALIYPINLLLGSDYLFINGKPATASLLDALPPWPYYLIFMEILLVVVFLILYLPFIIKDWRARVRARAVPA
ncbi:MAG TPA: TIGR02206 family membrane protein [Anaerolineales bacterium]|nr:TIGR02206 family membrane protein [Anaerolineales bacterium]